MIGASTRSDFRGNSLGLDKKLVPLAPIIKLDWLAAGMDTEPWFLLTKKPSSVVRFCTFKIVPFSGAPNKVLVFLRSNYEVLIVCSANILGFRFLGVPKSLALGIGDGDD